MNRVALKDAGSQRQLAGAQDLVETQGFLDMIRAHSRAAHFGYGSADAESFPDIVCQASNIES